MPTRAVSFNSKWNCGSVSQGLSISIACAECCRATLLSTSVRFCNCRNGTTWSIRTPACMVKWSSGACKRRASIMIANLLCSCFHSQARIWAVKTDALALKITQHRWMTPQLLVLANLSRKRLAVERHYLGCKLTLHHCPRLELWKYIVCSANVWKTRLTIKKLWCLIIKVMRFVLALEGSWRLEEPL